MNISTQLTLQLRIIHTMYAYERLTYAQLSEFYSGKCFHILIFMQ